MFVEEDLFRFRERGRYNSVKNKIGLEGVGGCLVIRADIYFPKVQSEDIGDAEP